MKGYFTSLARQTGLRIGGRVEPSSIGKKAGSQIYSKESRQVEEQKSDSFEVAHKVPSEFHDESSQPIRPAAPDETRAIEASPMPRPAHETEPQPFINKGKTQNVGPEAEESHETLQKIHRSFVPFAKTQAGPQLLVREKAEESRLDPRKGEDTKNIVSEKIYSSFSDRQRDKETIPSIHSTEAQENPKKLLGSQRDTGEESLFHPKPTLPGGVSDHTPERQGTWLNTLRAVREWVGETPEETEKSQSRDASGFERVSQSEPKGLGQRESSVDSRQMASQHSKATDIQELNLTIGTIQLTVEAQNNIQPHEPLPRREAGHAKSEIQSTRLSRYYL